LQAVDIGLKLVLEIIYRINNRVLKFTAKQINNKFLKPTIFTQFTLQRIN
jgi:hypothetical protein